MGYFIDSREEKRINSILDENIMLPDGALSIVNFFSTPYRISFMIIDSELEQQRDAVKKTSIEGFEVTSKDISFKGTWLAHFCRPE